MEISKIQDTIKLKGKNASVLIDPASKGEAQIVIATQPLESLALDKVEGVRLVISGPGEYEVGGVSINGREVKGGMIYQITDQSNILFAPSSAISAVPEDEEFDCLLIKVISTLKDDDLGPISTKCTALYGDLNLATVKSDNRQSASKINVKKTAEIQGKTFLMN